MAKLLIDDILKLNSTKQSINKIDLFLANEPKYSDDYMKAIAYKALIMHSLKDTQEALKILFSYINEISKMTYVGIIALCDGIINICIDIKRYDQAEKYILIKKDFLPISKSSFYQKDKINLLLHQGKKSDAKAELESYIKDDISKDEKMEAIKMLSEIYYDCNEYEKYKNIVGQLKTYYKSNFNYAEIEKIDKNILLITYKEKNYIDFINGANKALERYDDNNDILEIASLLISSYIELLDNHKASIVEASYQSLAYEENSNEAIMFCEAGIKLYQKFDNLVAIEKYNNRIEEIKEALNIKPKKENKKQEKYEIPNVNIKPIKTKKPISVITNITNVLNTKEDSEIINTKVYNTRQKTVIYKNVLVSEFYNKIFNTIDEIYKIGYDVKFREFFRQAMIILSKEYGFDEAYLLYNKDDSFKGFHYKLERVYDKKPDISLLENTLPYYSYMEEKEGYFDDENKEYSKNIINGEEYGIENLFSIPLKNDLDTIGSLTFISYTKFFEKEMEYEALKIFTKIINFNLNTFLKFEDINNNYEKLNFITSHMPYGIKEEHDDKISLSYQAKVMLNMLSEVDILDYYSHMNNNDLSNYKNIKNALKEDVGISKEIEYDFKINDKKIRIKEYMHSLMIDNNYEIISILEDISQVKEDKDKLKDLAYTNPISKIDTEIKLLVDIAKSYPNGKVALAVVEVDDFNLYKELYGYNFEYQLIYALGVSLKENIKNDFYIKLYHLGQDDFVILFENDNDKRVINSKLKHILDNTKNDLHKLNTRLNLNFKVGVYRSLKTEHITDYNELIIRAKDALNDTTLIDEYPKIAFYDSILAKARFTSNALVTHISEAIDTNLLSLTYKQIVNINKMEVLGYFVDVNLDNYEIEASKIYEVVERRNLGSKLFKYMLINMFKEEKIFYSQSKAFLSVFMRLDSKYLNNEVLAILKKNLDFYKVRASAITFIVDDTNNPIVKAIKNMGFLIASNNLFDIYRNNVKYFLLDYNTNKNIALDINNLCKDYKVDIILSNVNDKDGIEFAKEKGFSYIFGNYYKRLNRMKDIIKKVE